MGGRTLTFVGFQEPIPEIPAGALLRVSLAHRWRPADRPEEEDRCFVQLSGWFFEGAAQKTIERCTLKATTPAASHHGEMQRPASDAPPVKSLPNVILQERASEALKCVFGFPDFLPVQGDVIARALEHQDALVVMPTGGDKSLCYQLPALLFEGLTVVVSPLIALMHDQVGHLERVGVAAACLNHMVSIRDYTGIANRVRRGLIRILYLAPETLLRPETLVLLEQSRLTCLAIDEAHCISEWGHDFRPEYRQLEAVRRRFPQAFCLALTATATPRVREDIRRLLGIAADAEFVASFNRSNLFLAVEPRTDGLGQVLGFLEKRRGRSGIIYCGTRKQADDLCASLNANGWPALPYHAGLDDAVRRCNQERFIRDEVPLMVATVAFGMGINKPNLRFVLHASLPKDLESYYQEIGRAGRDGQRADCLLLYNRGDAMVHRHFIEQGAESERAGREARLQALMRFADARNCRRQPLLAYFGETIEPCGHCDNCVQAPADHPTTDVTAAAQKFLSCIKLTGQTLGPPHIIAVLRGSRAERVMARRHDRLDVFGTGKEHSIEAWRALAEQFVRLGLVERDLEFGGLHLTPKGWNVLQRKERVVIPAECLAAAANRKSRAQNHEPGSVTRFAAPRRFEEVGRLFAAGQTIEEIAQRYDIVPETVIQNLCRFYDSGGVLDPARLLRASRLSQSERAQVFEAFERLGRARLAPVFAALSGSVSYEELLLLRLYWSCRGLRRPDQAQDKACRSAD
jgi:ATP-dependent DNA helicase RecQ